MPTRDEKEERGVVVKAEVEANATNSDGHDIPVLDMSSGDAEDDEHPCVIAMKFGPRLSHWAANRLRARARF